MAVRAEHHALVKLITDTLPRPSVPVLGDTEVFERRVTVVEVECGGAAVVSADLTLSAFVFYGALFYTLAPRLDFRFVAALVGTEQTRFAVIEGYCFGLAEMPFTFHS
jgi:hypothetical protein